jgi:hypothetical protein
VKDPNHVIGTTFDGSKVYATKDEIDPVFLCVSVEHTDYAPLSFEEVQARIDARWEKTGYKLEAKAWGNGSGPG